MEATTTTTHTSKDVRFAAYMADQFGDRLLGSQQTLWVELFGVFHANTLLGGVVSAVREYHREVFGEPAPGLPLSWRQDYVRSITAATRVIRRTPQVMGGVPIVAQIDSPVEGSAVFNVFSPLAIEALTLFSDQDDTDPDQQRPSMPESKSWSVVARHAIPHTPWVKLVEPRQASRGFIALLADSTRTAFQAFARTRKTLQPLIIDGRRNGYLLRVMDEFAYDPIAFGDTLTYQVSGALRPGRYRFEGVLEGRLRQDRTTYQVNEDTTRLFLDGV